MRTRTRRTMNKMIEVGVFVLAATNRGKTKLLVVGDRNTLGIRDARGGHRLLRNVDCLTFVEGVPSKMNISLLQSKQSPVPSNTNSLTYVQAQRKHPTSMELSTFLTHNDISGNHFLTRGQLAKNGNTLRISLHRGIWDWSLFRLVSFLQTGCERSGKLLQSNRLAMKALPWGKQAFTAERHRPACTRNAILG